MAFKEIFAGSPPEGKALTDLLGELQGLKASAAAGAAVDTNIAVTGIALDDTLVAVIEIDIAGDAVAIRTAEAAITSAGNIQLDTTNTTASHLLILWADKSGA